MSVVQIVASVAVQFYPDGMTPKWYKPGEVYEVQEHVARGMIERGWAKQPTQDELHKLLELLQAEAQPVEQTTEPKVDDAPTRTGRRRRGEE